MNENTHTLRQVVGRRVAELRQAAGLRQDDLAAAARLYGLAWSQSKVAALERGDKAISAEELLLLPLVLDHAGAAATGVADLLPQDGSWVGLVATTRVRACVLRHVVAGRAEDVLVADVDSPGFPGPEMDQQLSRAVLDVGKHVARAERIFQVVAPGRQGNVPARSVFNAAKRDAEQSAGRRFGVPPLVVACVAYALWGRGLSDQRDASVAARLGPSASARSARAVRGRVTRELDRELRPLIQRWQRDGET